MVEKSINECMRICIIYDTKRGSTERIVNWMAEGLRELDDVKVDIKRPGEVENFDYDLFIVGSPIYYEKPLKSITDFLKNNQNNLKKQESRSICGLHCRYVWSLF